MRSDGAERPARPQSQADQGDALEPGTRRPPALVSGSLLGVGASAANICNHGEASCRNEKTQRPDGESRTATCAARRPRLRQHQRTRAKPDRGEDHIYRPTAADRGDARDRKPGAVSSPDRNQTAGSWGINEFAGRDSNPDCRRCRAMLQDHQNGEASIANCEHRQQHPQSSPAVKRCRDARRTVAQLRPMRRSRGRPTIAATRR